MRELILKGLAVTAHLLPTTILLTAASRCKNINTADFKKEGS